MKNILFKTILIVNFLFILMSCKSQTTLNDYITFYNGVSSKLNIIVPNKAQFINQNFSNFYLELKNKNIIIKNIGTSSKEANSPKDYLLSLYFSDSDITNFVFNKNVFTYQYPVVWITFQNEIPPEVNNVIRSYYGDWNENVAQLFSNMKIEKIEFVGINGYNNPDRSVK